MRAASLLRNHSVRPHSTSLKGVFCPAVTPFDDQLNPDIALFIEHCHQLLEEGCHGLAVFGTTGEANSLSVDERMLLLNALVESGIDGSVIVPGTGCAALTDSVRLTQHAVELGCRGVLMLPPFYYKDVSNDGLFRAFAQIIERVGDQRLKIYLYHIPPVSGVPLDLPLVGRLADTYPDCVVGLKDSSGEWLYTEKLLRTRPGFGAFSGSEIFLRNNLLAGGCGTITASANVNAPAIRSAYDSFKDEKGEVLQADITRRRKIIQAHPMIPALKSILATVAKDDNWRRVRPPLLPLSSTDSNNLIKSLVMDGYPPLTKMAITIEQ